MSCKVYVDGDGLRAELSSDLDASGPSWLVGAIAIAGLMLSGAASAQTVSCVSDTQTPTPIFSVPVAKSIFPTLTSAIPASTLPMPPLPISSLPTASASDPCITVLTLPANTPASSPDAMAVGPMGISGSRPPIVTSNGCPLIRPIH
jgi:hypothetical protein